MLYCDISLRSSYSPILYPKCAAVDGELKKKRGKQQKVEINAFEAGERK